CGPNPLSTSEELTACRSVTSASSSLDMRELTSQVKPYSSLVTSTGRPPSWPELMLSRSCTSFCTSAKDRPSTGRKQTEPEPVGLNPAAASRVTAAEGSANRSSSLGWTGLVRPSRVSRKPTGALLLVTWFTWFTGRG